MYEVRVHEQAQATLDALLAEVIVAYMGVLDVLEVAPWSGEPLRGDNPGGNVRTLVFGPGGDGLVFYLIPEDQRRVGVLEVQWAG